MSNDIDPREADQNCEKTRAISIYVAVTIIGLILAGLTAWSIRRTWGERMIENGSGLLAHKSKFVVDPAKSKRSSDLALLPALRSWDYSRAGPVPMPSGLYDKIAMDNHVLIPPGITLPSLNYGPSDNLVVPIPPPVKVTDEQQNQSDPSAFDEAMRLQNLRTHIVSLCVDLDGNVWIGTEYNGIQKLSLGAPKWKQWTEYRTRDGLGDDSAYALTCDHQGRIWVGHVNHGVSVFDGGRWQNYDVVAGINRADSLAGPIGERVYAIKVCPTDGDVWIATNAGLARYSESKKQWMYYTRARGLPNDQASAIAFDQDGNIYLATQCDGVLMANASDQYFDWHRANAPDDLPAQSFGTGLPTTMTNDILVARTGTVYVATIAGLAWSIDHGHSWRYARGADWVDKVQGSIRGAEVDWTPLTRALLAEDYVVCLGEDLRGSIYIGYRNNGWERFIQESDGSLTPVGKGGSGYVSAFPPIMNGIHMFATYGNGTVFVGTGLAENLERISHPRPIVAMPAGANPPNASDLRRILGDIIAVPPDLGDSSLRVVSIEDDWRTQGDWLGRYGRYFAILPAISGAEDYIWGSGPESVPFAVQIGEHHKVNDSVRRWVSQLYTDDPRIPEMPPVYMDSRLKQGYVATPAADRRLGQWDDHGEEYANTYEGPDLFVGINVPEGTFMLSVYHVNDNAHAVPNRDFKMIIKAHRVGDLSDLGGFSQEAELASTRVVNFWSGVYKRFVVHGPLALTIKVCRQYSLNANISGVMLDLLDERPMPYFIPVEKWMEEKSERSRRVGTNLAMWTGGAARNATNPAPGLTALELVQQIANRLNDLAEWNLSWWAIHSREDETLLARWCAANSHNEAVLLRGSCFYRVGLYNAWESCMHIEHQTTAREIEKSLRWDGEMSGYSGRGYETVRNYLASIHATMK
jgi:hypothetical protein